MIAAFTFSALLLSVLYYAVRAADVRLESVGVRKRKRWISGLGCGVMVPLVAFLMREPNVDQKMLGFLAGLLVVCIVMFTASFLVSRKKEGPNQSSQPTRSARG